jgi:hypothetical protein
MLVCFAALNLLDFNTEATELKAEWNIPKGVMSEFEDDVVPVAEAVLWTRYASLQGVPADIEKLRFQVKDWARAKSASDQAKIKDRQPLDATTMPCLVAAARYCYDSNPSEYRASKYNSKFTAFGATLINPGTRAGERIPRQAEKLQLTAASEVAGIAWFKEFAAWAQTVQPDISGSNK